MTTSGTDGEPPMPYIDATVDPPEIVVPTGARMSDALVVMVEGAESGCEVKRK